MSMKLFGSLGSYDHPSFGSRETRIRISPSASHSHMIACKIRPFTGNAASNSRPVLIGRGTRVRTAAAMINPTTRDLQGVTGLYYETNTGGAAIPEERLVHNYLIEAGLAGRIPKGIRIWEETLRDGEQTPGVAYTPEEKVQIARFLDEIHVPIMDVGIPVVSKEEARGVRAIADAGLDATVMAAARTVRKDVDACIDCGVDEIALFTAGSDLHIRHKLGMTREQVKEVAVRETEYAVAHGVEVSFVTEDTFRADLDFVVDLYNACTDAGAHRAVVCDNAFAQESGIPAHGVIKHTATYEPIQPERIGRQRTFVFGKHTGSLAVAEKLRSLGAEATPDQVLRLVALIKDFAEGRSKKDQQEFIRSFRDRVDRQRGVTDDEFRSLAQRAGIAVRTQPKS